MLRDKEQELLKQLKKVTDDLETQVKELTNAINDLKIQQLIEQGEWL